MSPTSRPIDPGRPPVVAALALIVAIVVALLGTWSARPEEPGAGESRVRVGLFDRAHVEARSDDRLEQALAAVGADARLSWIGARPASPEWRAADVEVVDVTDALRVRLAEKAK